MYAKLSDESRHVSSSVSSGYQTTDRTTTSSRIASALFAVAITVLPPTPQPGFSDASTRKLTVQQKPHTYSLANANCIDAESESIAHLSSRLQAGYGCNIAQWAALLKVERKTIYNWKENPETRPQLRHNARLKVLEAFLGEIDPGHGPYIIKAAFGRRPNIALAKTLTGEPLELDALTNHYNNLYSELDGRYKRDKHKVARG
ncbi:hypothetical protein A9Q88_11965 [Gammaproteobacteria bacterium 50_400_T64]|nr:hypothetical protein A9Q88_11965 [Gammaproteobacteria bacterium 50_400_T64]